MASSPDESAMGRLGDLYEEALAALQGGDFELARELVEAAEPLLPAEPPAAPEEDGTSEHARAVQAHRSLLEALSSERDATLADLMRLRQGRGALAGYGNRLDVTGTRLQRDG